MEEQIYAFIMETTEKPIFQHCNFTQKISISVRKMVSVMNLFNIVYQL